MNDKPTITVDALLKAGFKPMDDPQFKFNYDLSAVGEEYESVDPPAILWDNITGRFCVTDGEMMFIYFNAASPEEAVEWANKITEFEPN